MLGPFISSDAGGASGMCNMRSQRLNSVCSVPDSKTKKTPYPGETKRDHSQNQKWPLSLRREGKG